MWSQILVAFRSAKVAFSAAAFAERKATISATAFAERKATISAVALFAGGRFQHRYGEHFARPELQIEFPFPLPVVFGPPHDHGIMISAPRLQRRRHELARFPQRSHLEAFDKDLGGLGDVQR